MSAKRLTESKQIEEGCILQLGTIANPCKVLLETYRDEDAVKTMYITGLRPEEIQALEDFDGENPSYQNVLKYTCLQEAHVKVKVNSRCSITNMAGESVPVKEAIRYGNSVCVIVVPFQYTFEGKSGVSLQARAIRLCPNVGDPVGYVFQ